MSRPIRERVLHGLGQHVKIAGGFATELRERVRIRIARRQDPQRLGQRHTARRRRRHRQHPQTPVAHLDRRPLRGLVALQVLPGHHAPVLSHDAGDLPGDGALVKSVRSRDPQLPQSPRQIRTSKAISLLPFRDPRASGDGREQFLRRCAGGLHSARDQRRGIHA